MSLVLLCPPSIPTEFTSLRARWISSIGSVLVDSQRLNHSVMVLTRDQRFVRSFMILSLGEISIFVDASGDLVVRGAMVNVWWLPLTVICPALLLSCSQHALVSLLHSLGLPLLKEGMKGSYDVSSYILPDWRHITPFSLSYLSHSPSSSYSRYFAHSFVNAVPEMSEI